MDAAKSKYQYIIVFQEMFGNIIPVVVLEDLDRVVTVSVIWSISDLQGKHWQRVHSVGSHSMASSSDM